MTLRAVLGAAFAALALAAPAGAAGRCGDPAERPWCDTSKSADERARLLVDALTLEERIGLMAGDNATSVLTGDPATGVVDGVPRLGVPTLYMSDGPVGPREGRVTAMPSPLAIASSFDPRVSAAVGRAISEEVKAKGNDLVHAPTVDIMRTPLAGRTFEGYGEDPFLSARMAVAWIKAAQATGVLANVKHFAPNSQEGQVGVPPATAVIGGRQAMNAVVDERTLREIYFPPFEAAVKEAQVGSVMCAYNQLNGVPSCANRELLTETLRRDWGFDGFVVSDYFFAIKSTADSVNNGTEIQMPIGDFYAPPLLQAAVASGAISPETIAERLRNVMRPLFRIGYFDRVAYASDDAQIDRAAHAAVARKNLERGSVLLRNQGVLPLDPGQLRTIAVIGDEASTVLKNGGGSSAVTPFEFNAPLPAITERAGPGVEVRFDPGVEPAAAAAAARDADVAIVFASDTASEGVDKTCLSLTCTGQSGDEDAVIEAVAEANPATVVVLQTAGPVLTPWREDVEAILQTWYPGQEAGPAIARILFGDVDPGGRLPVTFPRRSEDTPTAGDFSAYPGGVFREGVLVGYRHYDAKDLDPAYPFGHGLSYTSFAMGRPVVHSAADGAATVHVTARNTGTRRGSAIPQVYVGVAQPDPPIVMPPRQLQGFGKVTLDPGERRKLRIALAPRAFSYWDAEAGEFRIPPGCHDVLVGWSSREILRRRAVAQGGATCAAACPAVVRRARLYRARCGLVRRVALSRGLVRFRMADPARVRLQVVRRGRVVRTLKARGPRTSGRFRVRRYATGRHRLRLRSVAAVDRATVVLRP